MTPPVQAPRIGGHMVRRFLLALSACLLLASCAVAGAATVRPGHPAAGGHGGGRVAQGGDPAPTAPAPVCGTAVLQSPYSYDGGATTFTSGQSGLPTFGSAGTSYPLATSGVIIPAGDNSANAHAGVYEPANTVYYFEPGVHVIDNGMYSGANSAYIGGYAAGPGEATIDGQGGPGLSASTTGVNQADMFWEYLTIKNMESSRDGGILGDVNGAAFGDGNTYKFDTIGPNEYGPLGQGQDSAGGYAIDGSNNTTIDHTCLDHNAQGGFNLFGLNNVITDNEVSWNGLGEYPDNGNNPYSCGCSAGGKIFFSVNAVFTGNYVHDNYNGGVWFDFNNTGADISGNYIASNWAAGISYEASYNANISDNTLIGNGWGSDGAWPGGGAYQCFADVSCAGGFGPVTGAGGGFAFAAIGIENSGGNANLDAIAVPDTIAVAGCPSGCTVHSAYSGQMLIQGNVISYNFGGVMVYTDTDRYPGNIDNDSACSVPLGALSQANSTVYYQQTEELTTAADATVSGTSVTSAGGTLTLCSDYGATQASEGGGGGPGGVVQAPSPGMAVFNINTGALVGTISTVTSANSFTLNAPAAGATNARLYIAAYGGCSPADYYGGGPGVQSGTPPAFYWDNCIWGSRGNSISGNVLKTQSNSITGCTAANLCGVVMNVAFNAGVPVFMQFFDQYSSLTGLGSGGLGNVYSANTYSWTGNGGSGDWQFWAGLQGNAVSRAQWLALGQDAGSTFSVTPAPGCFGLTALRVPASAGRAAACPAAAPAAPFHPAQPPQRCPAARDRITHKPERVCL